MARYLGANIVSATKRHKHNPRGERCGGSMTRAGWKLRQAHQVDRHQRYINCRMKGSTDKLINDSLPTKTLIGLGKGAIVKLKV